MDTTQPSVQWVLGLRISGAMLLLPLYAVMARTGIALPSTFSPSAANLPLYDTFSEVITREESQVKVIQTRRMLNCTVRKGVDISR